MPVRGGRRHESGLFTGKLLHGGHVHSTPSLTRSGVPDFIGVPRFYELHVGVAAECPSVPNAPLPADGGEERHVRLNALHFSTCWAALGGNIRLLSAPPAKQNRSELGVRSPACARPLKGGGPRQRGRWENGGGRAGQLFKVERESAASVLDACLLDHLCVRQPAPTPPYFTYHRPTCT